MERGRVLGNFEFLEKIKFPVTNSPFSLRGRGLGGWGLMSSVIRKPSLSGEGAQSAGEV